jgi:hypothetical protein
MKVIERVVFQGSMLTSTTATEAYSNWSNATTYSINARVVYSGRIYESLQNSNTNHIPSSSPTWWVDIGPSNGFAMFDQQISTGTTAGTSLTVVFQPGTIDSLALINLNTDTVQIVVKDSPGGTIVYDQTGGLSFVSVSDWYQYFVYDPLLKRTQLVFYGIPPIADCEVTLTFASSTSISVGECVFGLLNSIGLTQFGASAGIIDYSRKETDDFGTVTFVKRPYSKRLNAEVYVQRADINRVQRLLYNLRAAPAVWIASEESDLEEVALVYGFYREFTCNIAYPSHSIYQIEIEGLT